MRLCSGSSPNKTQRFGVTRLYNKTISLKGEITHWLSISLFVRKPYPVSKRAEHVTTFYSVF